MKKKEISCQTTKHPVHDITMKRLSSRWLLVLYLLKWDCCDTRTSTRVRFKERCTQSCPTRLGIHIRSANYDQSVPEPIDTKSVWTSDQTTRQPPWKNELLEGPNANPSIAHHRFRLPNHYPVNYPVIHWKREKKKFRVRCHIFEGREEAYSISAVWLGNAAETWETESCSEHTDSLDPNTPSLLQYTEPAGYTLQGIETNQKRPWSPPEQPHTFY